MRVGFIGLGRMGSHMSRSLLRASLAVNVYDVDPAPMKELEREGATVALSPAEVGAGSNVTILMVHDQQQAETAVYGEAGYAAGTRAGKTLVIMSSLPPNFVAELAGDFETKGIHLLDAPVSGGVEGAQQASLTIMAAGSDTAFQAAEPILAKMGRNLYRVGLCPGQGQTLKALNQAMYFTGLAVAAEVLVTGSKAGIDPDVMVEVIARSSGDNWALRNRVPLAWRNDYRSGGSLAVAIKDLRTALDIGREFDMPLPVTTATAQIFGLAGRLGAADADDPEVVRTIEILAGHVLQKGERDAGRSID
ncbi:NAD(P)-dependent oxidoreductase [Aurantimonas sp. C2-5-R2]|uniref:NAD(P)-dependent oxidoreductase n=1 Tax=Aurantimonas sp. C2-5-R2 TaxID=3113713 RepID=UPI002F91E656